MTVSLLKAFNQSADNQNKPLISIIIPAYNADKYLLGCLTTVCQQSYKNIEILVVNDGSTDQTNWNVVKSLDSRIKVFHKKNGGASSARNVGLDNAKGSYIAFIDVDDVVDSLYIETLLAGFSVYDVGIVACNTLYCRDDEVGVDYLHARAKHNPLQWSESCEDEPGETYIRNLVDVWGKLFKRSAIGTLRFDETLKYNEDTKFIRTVFFMSNGIYFLPYVGYHCIEHSGSICSVARISLVEQERERKDSAAVLEYLNDVGPKYYRKSNAKVITNKL